MGFKPEDCRMAGHWSLKKKYDDLKPLQQAVYRKFIQGRLQYSIWHPPRSRRESQKDEANAVKATPKSGLRHRSAQGSAVVAFGSQVGLGAGCKFPSAGAHSITSTLSFESAVPCMTVLCYALLAVLLSLGAYKVFRVIQLWSQRHLMMWQPVESCKKRHPSSRT